MDVERYPEWARDVKSATVKERDAEGRPLLVEFRASALGRSTHYTLEYDWSGAPDRVSWSLAQGDIMRAIDGAYTFSPSADGRECPPAGAAACPNRESSSGVALAAAGAAAAPGSASASRDAAAAD